MYCHVDIHISSRTPAQNAKFSGLNALGDVLQARSRLPVKVNCD